MKKKFLHNIFLIIQKFISSQLFLLSVIIYSLVVVFYRSIIYVFSPFAFYLLMIILCILLSLLIYIKLYTWRNLDRSVSSFIFFSINLLQLTLYLSAISFLFSIWFYHKTLEPIYLENLSVSSQYRYLFLFVISFFFICGFIVFFIANRFMDYKLPNLSLLTYPYLKEEFRILLDTWGNSFIINLFNKITNLLYFSFIFQVMFFIIHFILFSITRLITATFLLYCVFYHGDFRNFLYLTPIMLFIWLLSFLNYYFIIFQQESKTYIRDLITAVPKTKSKTILGVFKVDSSQISFGLTEKAISEGFCDLDMYNLTKEWYIQAHISACFQVYFKLSSYVNYIILIMNILSWFYISYICFLLSPTDYILSGGIWSWLNCVNKSTSRAYATEVRRVLPFYQKKLNQETGGAHQGNHPALVDPIIRDPDNPHRMLYEGQPTHGVGSTSNPSKPLHPSKDLQGNPRPQNYVPAPSNTTFVDENGFDPTPIPGSQAFLADSNVKKNLAEHSPKDENT